MIRAILASAVFHGFLISMILLVSMTGHESGGFVDNRIQIRIGGNPNAQHIPEPSTARSRPFPRNSTAMPKVDEGGMVDELAALLEYVPPASPRPSPGEQIRDIEIMNPLVNADEQPNSKSTSQAPLQINWMSGREREIVSFPVIDVEKIPQKPEKLLDVVIKIKVSAQGEVLSAEIIPPGSGDTRIDRYIHSAALQLTLEPLLENEGIQEALLRLLFLEDSL